MTLRRTAKFHSSAFIEPFTSSPLIDTAGNFVMYDIRLNAREAAYLKDNGLLTKTGQAAFKADNPEGWDLPRGTVEAGDLQAKHMARRDGAQDRLAHPAEGGDDVYFTLPGLVEIPAKHSATGETLCLDVTLGLVGMHIMQKISTPGNFSESGSGQRSNTPATPRWPKGAPISQLDDASSQQDDPPYGPVGSCPVRPIARATGHSSIPPAPMRPAPPARPIPSWPIPVSFFGRPSLLMPGAT